MANIAAMASVDVGTTLATGTPLRPDATRELVSGVADGRESAGSTIAVHDGVAAGDGLVEQGTEFPRLRAQRGRRGRI